MYRVIGVENNLEYLLETRVVRRDVRQQTFQSQNVERYGRVTNDLLVAEHFRFFEGHESRFNISLNISFGSGQTECLNILLQRCPEIEVDARNASGFTPLMKAALQGRTKCAKILLFAGKLIFFPPSLFFPFFATIRRKE